jgi:hypothetical protein
MILGQGYENRTEGCGGFFLDTFDKSLRGNETIFGPSSDKRTSNIEEMTVGANEPSLLPDHAAFHELRKRTTTSQFSLRI